MAERARDKGKRVAARRRNGAATAPAQPTEPNQRIKSLELERDRLTTELAEAKERIARLEASRSEVVNRIDWVIDSLHNVLEAGA